MRLDMFDVRLQCVGIMKHPPITMKSMTALLPSIVIFKEFLQIRDSICLATECSLQGSYVYM